MGSLSPWALAALFLMAALLGYLCRALEERGLARHHWRRGWRAAQESALQATRASGAADLPGPPPEPPDEFAGG